MSDPWETSREQPADYTDWKYAVANGDTMLGFLDWLEASREAEEDTP